MGKRQKTAMGRKEVTKIEGDAGEGVVDLRVKWFMVIYMTVVHLMPLYGLYQLFLAPKLSTVLLMVVCYWLSGLGITGGAHRLWAHRSYKASDSVRVFLMLCNSMANQGSIFHWARDHRVHHRRCATWQCCTERGASTALPTGTAADPTPTLIRPRIG